MKKDEVFNSQIKSKNLPAGLIFKLATTNEEEQITKLMSERNPHIAINTLIEKTRNEIMLNQTDNFYWLYVALIENEVVGFCRFFHTCNMPMNKKKYISPEGWYGMGILVAEKWRRNSIAQFLSLERIKVLKKLKASSLYSIVDIQNLASIRFHEKIGFKKIDEAHGFLHLDFNESLAYLYKLDF